MQLANYLASASASNIGETALMSKKMHVQWNDFDKQQMANNTNSKMIYMSSFDIVFG